MQIAYEEITLAHEPQADEAEITAETIHHQFVQGTLTEMANTISDEDKNAYCEVLRFKNFIR